MGLKVNYLSLTRNKIKNKRTSRLLMRDLCLRLGHGLTDCSVDNIVTNRSKEFSSDYDAVDTIVKSSSIEGGL